MRDRTRWTLHLAAALVLVVGLSAHLAVMHLSPSLHLAAAPGARPVAWASVVARTRGAAWAIGYVVLLGAGLYHGLYGLRTLLRELGPRPGTGRTLDATLAAAGVALFVFGAWVAVRGAAVARAAAGG